MSDSNKIPTYVLIGAGADDKKGNIEKFYRLEGVQVIKPEPNETAAHLAARIPSPANVILCCHGVTTDSRLFVWNDKQGISYQDFYKHLPRTGITSITLTECNDSGGVTPDALKLAPPGTIIQSMGAPGSEVALDTIEAFAYETSGGPQTQMKYLLKIFDNFNPTDYQQAMIAVNSLPGAHHYDTDPTHALPSAIYIAGEHPKTIDLNHEMARIGTSLNTPALREKMKAAIAEVKAAFDIAGTVDAGGGNYKWKFYNPRDPQDQKETKLLHQHIDKVAMDLLNNKPPHIDTSAAKDNSLLLQQVDDLRIAYAITAAYLDTSHQLQSQVEEAQVPAKTGRPR